MTTKKQRQRQLAREKWERQQSRRVEIRHRRRRRAKVAGAVLGVVAVVALVFAVVQLVRDDAPASAADENTPSATPKPTPTPEPETAPRPARTGDCEYVRQKNADQEFSGLPPAKVASAKAGSKTTATIQTDGGTIEAELFPDKARCAVNSFSYLAEQDAYDQSLCTYLSVDPAEHLTLGCGDLTGSGAGSPGYIFGNENDADRELERGWLVMAGPENRNDSQFYITYGELSKFDGPLTVFGKVTSGMRVVDEVVAKGLAPGSEKEGVGRPMTSAVVQDVKVTSE